MNNHTPQCQEAQRNGGPNCLCPDKWRGGRKFSHPDECGSNSEQAFETEMWDILVSVFDFIDPTRRQQAGNLILEAHQKAVAEADRQGQIAGYNAAEALAEDKIKAAEVALLKKLKGEDTKHTKGKKLYVRIEDIDAELKQRGENGS